MPKKIAFSSQSELVERLTLLRYGKHLPDARSLPILPFNAIAELTGYSASYVAQLVRSGLEPIVVVDTMAKPKKRKR